MRWVCLDLKQYSQKIYGSQTAVIGFSHLINIWLNVVKRRRSFENHDKLQKYASEDQSRKEDNFVVCSVLCCCYQLIFLSVVIFGVLYKIVFFFFLLQYIYSFVLWCWVDITNSFGLYRCYFFRYFFFAFWVLL